MLRGAPSPRCGCRSPCWPRWPWWCSPGRRCGSGGTSRPAVRPGGKRASAGPNPPPQAARSTADARTYSVRSATVRFGATVALDDVTVEVPGGASSRWSAGRRRKSTFLRAIAGEVSLDAGTVAAPPKQRLGYLPASSGSWAALTVAQNIDFVAGIYGLAGEELAARRAELLERAGLGPAVTASPRSCPAACAGSSASAWRSCTAGLLVLDEPSTGVDPVSRVDLWRLRRRPRRRRSGDHVDHVPGRGRASVEPGRPRPRTDPRAGILRQVLEAFAGAITRTKPVRTEWSWRRGRPRVLARAAPSSPRIRRRTPRSPPTWRTWSSRSRWPAATRFGVTGVLLRAGGHPPVRRVHRGGRRIDGGAPVKWSACSAPTAPGRRPSSGCSWG